MHEVTQCVHISAEGCQLEQTLDPSPGKGTRSKNSNCVALVKNTRNKFSNGSSCNEIKGIILVSGGSSLRRFVEQFIATACSVTSL